MPPPPVQIDLGRAEARVEISILDTPSESCFEALAGFRGLGENRHGDVPPLIRGRASALRFPAKRHSNHVAPP